LSASVFVAGVVEPANSSINFKKFFRGTFFGPYALRRLLKVVMDV
jgi:hypothetical protein